MTITCSTKVCSFGKQVVEKVETEYARFENGRFVYRIHRSPMCEYMINFIHKLKHLPEKYMMNSVLENFTILQVLELFFCLCCPSLMASSFIFFTRLYLSFFISFLDAAGGDESRHARDAPVRGLCFRSVHVGARSPAPHLQTGERLTVSTTNPQTGRPSSSSAL